MPDTPPICPPPAARTREAPVSVAATTTRLRRADDQGDGRVGTLRTARRSTTHRTAAEVRFALGDLRRVRVVVAELAARAGLDRRRTDELTVVVNELAANSVDHAGGTGTVRAWLEPDALVVEVADAGRLRDPDRAGRTPPRTDQDRGRGLWIARQLADVLEIRSGPHGTVVRVVTWL